MKFWNYSSQALAALLAAVSVVSAGGPSDGEAVADPDSAVVKLTTSEYKSFIESNPLVLAEFFAPWCGYCKQLGPEFSLAADMLSEKNPDIKLAQIDCTAEEEVCTANGVRGYPTLKVFRGSQELVEDYDGPREAAGIADYMIKETLPPVMEPVNSDELGTVLEAQQKPFIVQVLPENYNAAKDKTSGNQTFWDVAQKEKKNLNFVSVTGKENVDLLKTKLTKTNLKKVSSPRYFMVHPQFLDDAAEFSGSLSAETLATFINSEILPYFGDINRDTYASYMSSPLPIAYYFYKTPEQRKSVEDVINKLGKKHRGKINFAGLDANLYGRHAETLNMDPEVVPLFAIQDMSENKKYGLSQKDHPEGPSGKHIESFVTNYFKGKLEPIVKSEELPTEEEVASSPIVKLVAHNHDKIVKDITKDVFVKYYAPWCGHCKRLAPTWDQLGELYSSNKPDAKVVISKIDHTANDVNVPFEIAGYPTMLLYPANGEIDEKTGLRKPILFEGARQLDSLIDFVKEKGGHAVDGHELKPKEETSTEEQADAKEEEAATKEEKAEEDHDEL